MTIFNKGKPTRRPVFAFLASVLTVPAMVFAPSLAFADSGVDVSNWQGCVNSSRAA